MDEHHYERAAQLADAERQAAVAAARRRPEETPAVRDGVRVCLDCDEPIGASRLAVVPAAVRCTDCQNHHEQTRALGG